MRLYVLSDIHLEFAPFVPPRLDADVVVLAGDIHVGVKAIPWAKEHFARSTAIYVLGNHEYYRQALPKHIDKLKRLTRASNVHVLENDAVAVADVVFLGCTLWTDFELFGDPRVAGSHATQWMTDYRKIRVNPSIAGCARSTPPVFTVGPVSGSASNSNSGAERRSSW